LQAEDKTLDVPFNGTSTAGECSLSNDASNLTPRAKITLPDGGTEFLLHPSKLRAGSLLQVRVPEGEATPEEPSATEEQRVRPVDACEKGALFLDIEGKIASAQPRCAGFFGRQPEELVRFDLKDLLKSDFAQEVTNALENGRNGGVQSFQAVAVRKDGSEFPTQLTFKFLPGNRGFCWTVFVQPPPGHPGEADRKSSNGLTPTAAATETATQGETPEPETAEKPAADATAYSRLAGGFTTDTGHEAAKRTLQVQKDYRESAAGVEQESQSWRTRAEESETARKLLVADLERVRNSNKLLRKKEEELNTERQKLQAAVEQAETRARESAAQSSDWEKKAADFRKDIDELTRAQTATQGADTQFAARRVKELEQQLKDANANVSAANTKAEKLEVENRQLNEANAGTRADLDRERDAIKVAQEIAEGLNTQIQKLRGAAEQAEVRAQENAAQSRDWQQKAADLKKTVDELTCSRDNEKNADAQSAGRIKELELQLNEANTSLAETNTKSKADLEKEREAKELSQKEKEELSAQVQTLKSATEQAEVRARESAAQSKDWEKKVADLKKSVDGLTNRHATEQNAAVKAAQRVKELEEQLKRAGDDRVAGKKDVEAQDAARQRLEAENSKLIEASDRTKADLEKEREAKELSQKEKEELNAQVQTLKSATEQAEARARESAAQARDWEKKAADLKTTVDELTRSHTAGKNADAQSARRVEQLEEQLKDANACLNAGRAEAENLEAEIRKLNEANATNNVALDSERDAHKLFRQKATELNTQVRRFQHAADQAEARAAESAAQARDWEKKAADLRTTVDELTHSHTAGKNADAQSAQRVEELKKELEDAIASVTAGRTEAEKQNSARQRLEAENRNLAETNAQAKADLDKERDANELSQKEKEELNAQLQKLKSAAEQAEAHARESAAQSKDWEKKAGALKKSVEELTRSLAAEKNDAAQSAQRVEELEQQLEEADASLTAARTEAEKLNSTHQRLETENRNLAETNAQAKADFEKERDAKKLSQKEKDELNAQVQKLKSAAEQAEARARESAAQSKDWEKKAADLKKSVDEFTRSLAIEKNGAAQSVQRVKELQQQLNEANASLTVGRTNAEKLNSARQRLEEENHNLAETNAQAKADLKQERDFKRLSEKEKEKLHAQLQKVKGAAEEAEARARESAAQIKDWEKRAADLEKSVEELTQSHAVEKNAAAQSAQRVEELEEQLKRAVDDLAASRAEVVAMRYPARQAGRCTVTADATVWADLLQSAERQAMLEEKVAKLEEHVRKAERPRAENSASSAAAKFEKFKEKLKGSR
jgi:chromosome segregation ATPase